MELIKNCKIVRALVYFPILCFSAICCNYGFIVHIDGGNQSSYLDRQYTDDSCYRFSYYDYVYGCQRLWIKLIGYAFCKKESGRLNTLDFSLDITKEKTFWASLIGGSVMWIRYFCFDQSQVQRVLTSKSLKSAKNSFVVSVFVMNIVYYVMLLLGAILFVFYGGKDGRCYTE